MYADTQNRNTKRNKILRKRVEGIFFIEAFQDQGHFSGIAAKILGIERKDFIQLLSKYNVCYLDYELSDYEMKLISDAS